MGKHDSEYFFLVMRINGKRYKVFGIVTNMDLSEMRKERGSACRDEA